MSGCFNNIVKRIHDQLGHYLNKYGVMDADPAAIVKIPAHTGESESLNALLTGLGHHNPAEPLFMLEAFLLADNHLSADDFAEILDSSGRQISQEKAADALELFTSLGFAQKHFSEDGRAFYEHNHPGRHHDHIMCSGCGRTTEFNRPDVDNLIEKIACDEEYCHLSHRLVIYGLCPECRQRRAEGIPLTETAVGESVYVVGFNGPDDLKLRLGDMGLRRGSRLRVLGGQTGAIIVFMAGCRLAMGRELASGVMVRNTGRGHCGLRQRPNSIRMAHHRQG